MTVHAFSDAEVLNIHDSLTGLRAELAEAEARLKANDRKILRMQFCLTAVLSLDEKLNDPDLRSCCNLIRYALELPPVKGSKPQLIVNNEA